MPCGAEVVHLHTAPAAAGLARAAAVGKPATAKVSRRAANQRIDVIGTSGVGDQQQAYRSQRGPRGPAPGLRVDAIACHGRMRGTPKIGN